MTAVVLPQGTARLRADKMQYKADGTIVIEAPKGQIKFSTDQIRYSKEGPVLLNGKVSIAVQQEEHQSMEITADQATVEFSQAK